LAALALATAGIALPVTPAAGAAPTSPLVISELMYHPPETGEAYPSFRYNEDAEFVEVTNRSNSSVNASGWCLTDGIDFCFPAGTSIAGGDHVVVAKDSAAYGDLWGGSPDYTYSGKLSNGGETVILNNGAGTEVDRVDYDDEGLWPVTPDELGTSLERVDLDADGDDPANWSASTAGAGHTAGQTNSVAGDDVPPLVTSHAAPTNHPAGQSIAVTANISSATSATLEYLVDHGSVQSTSMARNGTTFSATVPGQSAGSLVRYRVIANGPGGTRSGPRAGDTIGWWGLTIADSTAANVPVLKWFVDPGDYQTAYNNFNSNTPCNGEACPMVLAYDGQVWDNVRFRVRGFTGRRADKKAWKIEMPKGHDFNPAFLDIPLDEFSFDPGRPQWDGFREALSWKIMEGAGVESVQLQHVHIEQNDAFYGYYLLREDPDGNWRERNGYDGDEFYKSRPRQVFEKRENKETDDNELTALRTCLNAVRAGGNSDCLYDLVDIPYAINELAAIAVSSNGDQREFNFLYAQSPNGDGRWRMLPEDLDRSWGSASANQNPTLASSERQCEAADNGRRNDVCGAIFAVPELKASYYRRIRTLYDELMANQQIETYLDSLVADAEPSWSLDAAAWGETSDTLTEHRNFLVNGFMAPWRSYLANGGSGGEIPSAQAAALSVELGVVDFAPATANLESIEITNNEPTPVDLSGWQLDGAGFTLPSGSVVPAGATVVAVLDDAAYTQANSGSHLLGVFPDALSDGGGEVRLLDGNGAQVDIVSWGTPADPSVILNEWNAVSSSNLLDGGAATDPFWGAVAGNGGDWFELVVTEDNVDLRGLELIISDDTGGAGQDVESLFFSNDALWADVRSGTIITVSEDLADDVSYDPAAGDWWINVQAANNGSGTYVTANNFKVSNDNWQLTIRDGGTTIFGPAGEGIAPSGGVGSEEVGKLEEDPSAAITPQSAYNDGSSSSFGAPNRWSAGTEVQDFSQLRSVVDAEPDTVIDAPAHRSTVTTSPVTFSGTATDPGGGITVVQIAIRDVPTGQWLRNDGTFGTFQWQNTDLADPGAATTGWSTDIALASGTYRVLSRATDTSGNREVVRPNNLFTVTAPSNDTEPANGELVTPQRNEALGQPAVLSGTATDDVAVGQVRIAVRDLDSGGWFNSSTGTFGSYHLQDATLTDPGTPSTDWNIEFDLPEGSYAVSVRAVDHLGKEDASRPWVRFTVQANVTDTTPPDATVATPVRNQALSGPAVTLLGAATDNVEVGSVGIAIRDRANSLWLQPDGTWGSYTRLPATLIGAGTQVDWELNVTLPAGSYGMLARAADGSGNVDPTKPWVVFTVN
jgi:hypothetical protein